MTTPIEFEGTLQQIYAEGSRYPNHKMRLTVLHGAAETGPMTTKDRNLEEATDPVIRPADGAESQMLPSVAQPIETDGLSPARAGSQPVLNLETFLASLPHFEEGEVQDLWDAIAENRREQRALERRVTD